MYDLHKSLNYHISQVIPLCPSWPNEDKEKGRSIVHCHTLTSVLQMLFHLVFRPLPSVNMAGSLAVDIHCKEPKWLP